MFQVFSCKDNKLGLYKPLTKKLSPTTYFKAFFFKLFNFCCTRIWNLNFVFKVIQTNKKVLFFYTKIFVRTLN